MNTITSRLITFATACAMFGGQFGCVYMSDQIWDYGPFHPFHPFGAVVQIPIAAALASAAPVVNAMVDDRRLDEATGKKWHQRKTTRDYLRVALTCENPDVRRFAVRTIADSGDVASDWALEGLETVARQDSSSLVRRAAIRGLQRADEPRALRVTLRILSHEQDTDDVRPPDDELRWRCLLLLEDFCTRGLVRSPQREAVRDVMLRHLSQSYHHDVRFTAAKGLRYFEDMGSRTALTHVLKDGHVGVALRARQSLQMLADTERIGRDRREEIVSNTQRAGSPAGIEHRVATSIVLQQTPPEGGRIR